MTPRCLCLGGLMRRFAGLLAAVAILGGSGWAASSEPPSPEPQPPAPWTRQALVRFMGRLNEYVLAHHLRRDDSPMHGIVYEFYLPATGQQGYGGAWDTMHDGALLANACILAYRATGDRAFYAAVHDRIAPFYLRMLNQSDKLFPDREKAYSDGLLLPPDRSGRGKGFVPFWWDDGHGVNFDALFMKISIDALVGSRFGFTNTLPDRKARDGRVSGYSHGTSNRMAQNLCPMLANYWLLTRDPETARAIANLHQCRIRQMKTDLPCLAIAEYATRGNAKKASELAAPYDQAGWPPRSPLYDAMVAKKKMALPISLDEPAASYYTAMIGRHVGPGAAKRLALMTHGCIELADLWYGDKRRPRGLAIAADNGRKTVMIENGRFSSLAGEIPDVLVGSRMGPQTLWACAQSLQLLRAFPRAWAEEPKQRPKPVPEWSEPPLAKVQARFEEELNEGLRFWEREFQRLGYLRPNWPIGGRRPYLAYWGDRASEVGAYAHLMAACAAYIMLLDGKNDWELAWSVREK